jgi:hypothetical protein
MSWVPDPERGFAEVLRQAIERRGLGLERIRDHLELRGASISVAALSYWQSGRSRPERKSSLAALGHLESVLDLPAGTLHSALTAPTPRPRRTAVAQLDTLWPEGRAARVLQGLDTRWDADLDRISMHDMLEIGPDRRQRVLSVRQVMRARSDGPDRRVVLHSQKDRRAPLPAIRTLRGCRLGRTACDDEGGIIGAELVFLQPLRRGQTVLAEYEVVANGLGPLEDSYGRRLRLPAAEQLLQVSFDPAALPATCTAVSSDGQETQLLLDPAHSVHVVATPAGAGTTTIRWTWPATPPQVVGPGVNS